ncbi:MAG: FAD-binding and (Fe-S)-binding domain-containing protein [Vulcanimicrobiota bacterium]
MLELRTTEGRRGRFQGDRQQLGRALAAKVRGEVAFDDGYRALYATDGSNYRQVPLGVVFPRDGEDVMAAIAVARDLGAPILCRGGGTSLAGQCCNTAVILDMSRHMNRILEIDPDRKLARVQPGVVLDQFRKQAEPMGVTFGPDPSTHGWCTFGGMIGNDSCGIHSLEAGRTVDNVHALEIATYPGLQMTARQLDGDELARLCQGGGAESEVYRRLKGLRDGVAEEVRKRYPDIPRRVSGFNLDELLPENGFHLARALVGSEGTCVNILEATVDLIHYHPHRTVLVLGYRDIYEAADHIEDVLKHKPIGLEGIDHKLLSFMKRKDLHYEDAALLPDGEGWLLIEFGADTKAEANERAHQAKKELCDEGGPSGVVYEDKSDQDVVWEIRESGLGATAKVPAYPVTHPGWEDAAVPPLKEGPYLRDFRELLDNYGYDCALYGHFGQGCIHCRIDFDLRTRDGIDRYKSFASDAADLVLSYGGSLSGEHGDGQARGWLLERMYGRRLVEAFREFKSIWDPEWKMNPGKVVDADGPDENLRLGVDYRPALPETYFRFPQDQYSFAETTTRCVGVGKCRREEGGTMCPSYMVTRDEKHTTRGRAHLLFEMLQGEEIDKMWQSEEVKESLDLCLACKGCKSDCPVSVDMATYKAEFLAHYYEHHRRPRPAYAFGFIMYWARMAAFAPWLANLLTRIPGLPKLAAGIASQRDIPRFAGEPFTDWFRRQPLRAVGQTRVILWPDTFNNYFHPEILKAGLEVLEHAGYHVVIPAATLCCGRPLYDYGLLTHARRLLRQILDSLRDEIRAGTHVVGLEPSCVATFRDELVNLFPHDEDARRLAHQTFTLAEALQQTEGYEPPRLHRKALLHGHCHHKSIMGLRQERKLLERMGLDFEILDSGCCGMAGGFGFEEEKYELSIACGERALLPRVRQADDDTLLLADGFSCQEQVCQTTSRRPLHLAQVLQMALREGPDGPAGGRPERHYPRARYQAGPRQLLVAGGLVALGWWLARNLRMRARDTEA